MQDNRVRAASVCRVVWGTIGGFLWTLSGPIYDLWYAVVVSGLLVALLFLPWQKIPWAARGLSLFSAAMGIYAAGRMMSRFVLNSVPSWSVWLWIFILLAALVWCGRRALSQSVWLPALLTVAVLLLLFALSIPQWQISNYTPPQHRYWGRMALDLPVLLGAALTLWDGRPGDLRIGGAVAVGCWDTMSLTAAWCWHHNAAEMMPGPVTAAWSRISVFSVFSHPDLVALSMLAAAALWQAAAAWESTITLYRIKILGYNKEY